MKSLKYLNKYFYKYRGRLVLGTVFIILSNVFALLIGPLVRLALNLVTYNASLYPAFLGTGFVGEFRYSVANIAILFGGLILISALIKGFFMFLMRQTVIVVSRHIEYDLKNEIFDQYQKLSMSFYRKNFTGDLMNRISEDVSRVRMYLGPALMYTINLLTLFALVISTMFAISTKLTLLVLLPLPILSFSIYYVNNIINRRSDAIQKQLSNLTTFVQEAFSGIRVLKAFAVEGMSEKAFAKEVEDYKDKSMSLVKVNSLFIPLMMMLVGLSTLIVVYVGGREVMAGNLTVGNIAEFIIYVNMLTWPVAALGWVTSIVQRADASQARINEFLSLQPEIVSTSNTPFKYTDKIEFKNVTFSYGADKAPALQDVNFTINKGDTVAIVGGTGSGKSTIGNLILRMYDVSSGSVTIDEEDIRDVKLDDYREHIGYVPQDIFLFSDSIAENIAFGIKETDPEIKKERVVQAAKNADVYENIMDFPQQFETVLGERGITLSGGQKQRVAIARALIKSPDIVLLDDCLSAVDTKTEAQILANLKQVLADKTAIIISHRVSSTKNADKIIVLDDGKIAEQGTHDDLMRLKGKYYEMFQKQMAEEKVLEN